MKKLIIITAILVSGAAHADCAVQESMLQNLQQRADNFDAVKGRILFGPSIMQFENMLKDCLASEQRFKVESARRSKLPAPSIGQRKQETNWGYPEHVSTTTTARGVTEIQVFPGGSSLVYVNDVLTLLQRKY